MEECIDTIITKEEYVTDTVANPEDVKEKSGSNKEPDFSKCCGTLKPYLEAFGLSIYLQKGDDI